ncbi:hypothetical protein K439DRAFT_1623073 [Ramaria rubella]|nr:hypothetical protein K439DRAFT_1623073 [Ramaria rubella]
MEVLSAHTLFQDVQEVFAISQWEVRHVLQAYDGKLHLGVDGWAAPNVFSFLGVTVTHCITGDLITMILDFIRLTKSHSGAYLAEKLTECLKNKGNKVPVAQMWIAKRWIGLRVQLCDAFNILVMSGVLSDRQQEDLHRSMLDYLFSAGFTRTYEQMKQEALNVADFEPDANAKTTGLLVKKWTGVI